jgi:hypothetical protein
MLIFKTKKIEIDDSGGELAVIPPETHYLAAHYIVKIPVTDKHLDNRWELRKHAAKLVERSIGDEVQVTSLKVRKPHLIRKTAAKLRGQQPCATAYVTVKF